MARIPSFEETLLEINQSLGLERPQSKYIDQFADLGMPLDEHRDMGKEILDSIFSALDMGDQARSDIADNIFKWAGFHKALDLHTWTGNASQQQVLWHLLAYSYVPALARHVAFWNLAGVECQQPLDADMPGGKFWFLPRRDKENDRVELPVPQVCDWLLDLLGEQSRKQAFEGLEREIDGKSVNGDALRTLQNWRQGRLPKSARKIKELFHHDATLKFRGAFEVGEELSDEERFQEALAFAQRKKLDVPALRMQIPMTAERLEPVLIGSAPEGEKQEFVRLIALRYAKPTTCTISQRFLVARMVQDGYQRLLKSLCPEVDTTCADPARNKLLQLIGLFQDIYNLTIAAWQNGGNNKVQDAWFEAQLSPWNKEGLLLSILPSLDGEKRFSILAQRLTRKFMTLERDSPLEDLVPLDKEDAWPIIERCRRRLKQEHEEDRRLLELTERVRTASPWRALQSEESYWVVNQFAYQGGLPAKVQKLAVERLYDLAATPGQIVWTILIELSFLLNCEPKQRPEDIQQCVQGLLDKVEGNRGYEEWKAPLLRLRAKHRLMQNDFDGARVDFGAALDACSEHGLGGLRGEIARDGFAVEIVVRGFVPKEQEKYYRNMIAYGMFTEGVASVEDTAMWCEEFFWTALYHPYPGFEQKESPVSIEFKATFLEAFESIKNAEWDRLRLWMKRYGGKLRKTNLKDARRNSVLLLWLKILDQFERLFRVQIVPAGLAADKPQPLSVNLRYAIDLLLEAWPEQAKIADFKGQTPLMLVADNGDAELSRLLAPLSNVDAQDYRGRTALHSSVSGRSPECVAIVLDCNPDVAEVTTDEKNTALHTAIRFGQPDCVRLILEAFPGLAAQANAEGQTPLAMAQEIRGSLPGWLEFMQNNNRDTGSVEDFEAITALLKSDASDMAVEGRFPG